MDEKGKRYPENETTDKCDQNAHIFGHGNVLPRYVAEAISHTRSIYEVVWIAKMSQVEVDR